MSRVCIAGLCLGGNKGGPAILSSLVTLLRSRIPSLQVTLLSTDMKSDLPWLDHYGVDLIPKPGIKDLVRLFSIYRSCDLAIDMHGVKFVGANTLRANVAAMSTILVPVLVGKPVVSFTQTYGPFLNQMTKYAAKISLRNTRLLFAREPKSVHHLKSIGLGTKCELYPDVAFTLPTTRFEDLKLNDSIRNFIESSEPFIGISVSSKVLRHEKEANLPPKYEDTIREVITSLLRSGHRILLIPHTYRPQTPADDDYGLSQRIYRSLGPSTENCLLLNEELGPSDLKAIIARSYLFIGSRYHSLIAALSTGVPPISIGWNHKYDGLLGLFGMEQFSLWADQFTNNDVLYAVKEISNERQSYVDRVQSRYPALEAKVKESVSRVAQLIQP